MPVRYVIRDPVPERTTQRITAVVTDELDTPIPGSALATMTLTLYALDAAQTVINNRDHQDIKNANGGTIDEAGNLVLELGPADNAIIDTSVEVERHILLLEFTYAAGVKHGKQEIELRVVNLAKVPAA